MNLKRNKLKIKSYNTYVYKSEFHKRGGNIIYKFIEIMI